MPIRLLLVCLAVIARVGATSAAQPSSPDYRASLLCTDTGIPDDKPRLVVHAIDMLGDPLPGADVVVRRDQTEVKKGRTDANGRAVFEGLPVGRLRLEVDLEGFRRADVRDLRAERRCTTAISVPLEVGTLGGPAAP